MTRTLAAKVIEGLRNQGWEMIGRGGTWTGAMRPLEEYVKRRVEKAVAAEREACAKAYEAEADTWKAWPQAGAAKRKGAAAIRARGNKCPSTPKHSSTKKGTP